MPIVEGVVAGLLTQFVLSRAATEFSGNNEIRERLHEGDIEGAISIANRSEFEQILHAIHRTLTTEKALSSEEADEVISQLEADRYTPR